jgi:flagellar biosynthesis/type III secretory pathway protein FliH
MQIKTHTIIEEANERVRHAEAETDFAIESLYAQAQESGRKRGYEQGLELKHKLKMQHDDVAKNLLDAQLREHEESILQIALRVLTTIPDAKNVYVRANPQDADYLKAHKERLIDGLERAKDVDIRIDKQVARGGLIIQTEYGIIDAQMSTQLEELARAIGVHNGAYY